MVLGIWGLGPLGLQAAFARDGTRQKSWGLSGPFVAATWPLGSWGRHSQFRTKKKSPGQNRRVSR